MKYKALWLSLLAMPCFAQANETANAQPQNRISFQVEVEKEVAFDILRVKLFVQEEGSNLKTLHKNISDKLNQALSKIKAQPAVSIQSNDRSTSARYNEQGKKSGWVERADFVLESKDFYALSQLVDELSDVLSIEFINSDLSKESLSKFEDELTQSAMDKFKKRAALLQQSLNAKGYRVISLNLPAINDQNYPTPVRYRAAPMMAMAKMDSEAVQLESGKTNIKASVEATIELIEN